MSFSFIVCNDFLPFISELLNECKELEANIEKGNLKLQDRLNEVMYILKIL